MDGPAQPARRTLTGCTTAPFHRVIPDFMIQGGDPLGSGRGGPGYGSPTSSTLTSRSTGPTCSPWRTPGPGTNGSQFFITVAPTPLAEREAHHLRRGHRGRRRGGRDKPGEDGQPGQAGGGCHRRVGHGATRLMTIAKSREHHQRPGPGCEHAQRTLYRDRTEGSREDQLRRNPGPHLLSPPRPGNVRRLRPVRRPACPDCMRSASVGQQCADCVSEGARSTRRPRTTFGGRPGPVPW